jgi:hypothetical protein
MVRRSLWLVPLSMLLPVASVAAPEAGTADVRVSSDGAAAEVDATRSDAPDSPAAEPSGFEHGLRLGVALPVGKTGESNALRSGDMSGVVGLRIPIWLDIGYRLNRSWWVGLAPELGLGPTGSDCDDDQECEWSDLRLSAQATYSLSPDSASDPFIGIGLGWESLRGSITLTTASGESDQEIAVRLREVLQGPQLFVQGGMRWDAGEGLTVGPYLFGSAGTFLLESFHCPGGIPCPEDGGVDEPAIHAWFGLGVRGTHGP